MPLQVIALYCSLTNHQKNKLVEVVNDNHIKKWWDKAIVAMDASMRIFADAGAGTTTSMKLLAYPALIPIVAAALISSNYENEDPLGKANMEGKIKKYFFTSLLTNRFTQGASSKIKTDYDLVKSWLKDDKIPDFIDTVKISKTLLLEAKNNYGAVPCAFYCILNQNGPKDFYTKSDVKAFDGNVDLHHIFPKKGYTNLDTDRALNMGYLQKTTNESISNAPVHCYLNRIRKEICSGDEEMFSTIMGSQLIEGECLKSLCNEDYADFLEERLNQFLSTLAKLHGLKVELESSDKKNDSEDSDGADDEDEPVA